MEKFRIVRELDDIQEYELPTNGLRILLKEDPSVPVTTLMVSYRVGSRNENHLQRGAVHILEHMMFKGTPRYNKQSNTAIASVLQNVGAILNATTGNDGTNYFELLPSDQLGLALDIEADRMRQSLLRDEDLALEMPVVLSEFDRMENSPMIALEQAVWRTAFRIHPYHYPVIGTRESIRNMTTQKLREFYDTYYWPNNAVITVIGDFKTDEALSEIHKRFAKIPASPHPIPPMNILEPEQNQKGFVEVQKPDKINAVSIAHKTPPALHPDIPPLDVLAKILASGKTSRLYRALVETGYATTIGSDVEKTHDPGLFSTYIILTPGTKHEEAEKATLNVYEQIRTAGVTEAEVQRAKNQLYSRSAFARDSSISLANELIPWIAAGDWTYLVTHTYKIHKVTAADVKRVANTYLIDGKMTLGRLVSKEPEAPQEKTHPLPKEFPSGNVEFEKESESVSENAWPDTAVQSPGATILHPDELKKKLSDRIRVKNISGFKVMSIPTSVKDVVTVVGSFEGAGHAYADNPMIPLLTVSMLQQGTKYHDKFEF
ncbi:MAG: insulinase family protein, partial [Candidatus Omnitrophica bacterium]|nr:insulinase family protein [Candidatus Omnitrophota bacterium]